jgi:hypothetical protein
MHRYNNTTNHVLFLLCLALIAATLLFPPWTNGYYYFILEHPAQYGHAQKYYIDITKMVFQCIAAVALTFTAAVVIGSVRAIFSDEY